MRMIDGDMAAQEPLVNFINRKAEYRVTVTRSRLVSARVGAHNTSVKMINLNFKRLSPSKLASTYIRLNRLVKINYVLHLKQIAAGGGLAA